MPANAAVKKAKYNAAMISGKPKNKPKTKASLMSPPPIPSLPRMNLKPKAIKRKNNKAKTPQMKLIINNEGLMINKKIEIITASGNKILSKISPYFKSMKKITIKPETTIN
jgi:hypothetical protein